MGNRYYAGGRMNAATAATADHVACQLWNPASTKSIYVVEIMWTKTAAVADIHGLVRSSARGATPGATITPDADNASDRRAAPPSAAVLETAAFGTQPTLATPYLARTNLPAAIGAAWVLAFHDLPIEVPAGTGLCVATPSATAMQISDFFWAWDE